MSSRTFIIYYSRTGHAKELAESIAARLGAKLEHVELLRRQFDGWLGFARGLLATISRRDAAIKTPPSDLADYDTVVLCTPVWAGRLATPARTWLKAARGQIHNLAVCATAGGRRAPKLFAEAAEILDKPLVAVALLSDRDRNPKVRTTIIDRFLQEIAANSTSRTTGR